MKALLALLLAAALAAPAFCRPHFELAALIRKPSSGAGTKAKSRRGSAAAPLPSAPAPTTEEVARLNGFHLIAVQDQIGLIKPRAAIRKPALRPLLPGRPLLLKP